MKSTVLLAFVLLFALTSQPLLGVAEDASSTPEEVVDTSGNKKIRAYATSGVVGNIMGPHTILNGFKIVKYDGAYKLVYCPSGNGVPPCTSCHEGSSYGCRDVGVFVDENWEMHLALSYVPFKINFQHAGSQNFSQ